MSSVPRVRQARPDLEQVIRSKQRNLRVKAGLPPDETWRERLEHWWRFGRFDGMLDGVLETIAVMVILSGVAVAIVAFWALVAMAIAGALNG